MKIGLALGGGGVLGVAHLALLEELEKNHINISAVAGTSAGAIIGGLYAYGGVEIVNKFVLLLKERQLLSRRKILLSAHPDNLFIKIEELLKELIKDDDFSKLKKPLFLIATDIDKGCAVILDKGSVVAAIMASAAYPGVFSYRIINELRLIDGGVTNNLPTNILLDKGCDYIVASSLNQIRNTDEKAKLNRALVAARALDILLFKQEKSQRSLANYCFLPPIEEYRWYHFDKINEIYEKSQEYVKADIRHLIRDLDKRKGFFARLFSG